MLYADDSEHSVCSNFIRGYLSAYEEGKDSVPKRRHINFHTRTVMLLHLDYTEVYLIHQLIHNSIAIKIFLKFTLKLTLKQLQNVSV
jgi:hypothetical protein